MHHRVEALRGAAQKIRETGRLRSPHQLGFFESATGVEPLFASAFDFFSLVSSSSVSPMPIEKNAFGEMAKRGHLTPAARATKAVDYSLFMRKKSLTR